MGRAGLGWVLCGLALLPAPASANGNVSHQWVSHAAAEQTPPDGSLAELVTDPALRDALDTGTMFPDWGYTPGATADERDAGEASHWEPVQEGYRRWIAQQFAPPWSDEARRHLAFYMGMTSHGIADQSYDAMFYERSEFHQGGDHGMFDQDSDVLWSAHTGPGQAPEAWIPAEPLLDLFDAEVGTRLAEDDVSSQLGFVGIAISAVSALGQDPDQVMASAERYPWAAAHHDDPATPGNPPHEAEIVRRYWRSNWALLHDDSLPRPVLWTHPADGGANHEGDASSIESWVSIVFARALSAPHVDPARVHLTDTDGTAVPLELDLFYGDGSHVLHLQPQATLAPDTVYVVTIDPGFVTIHDETLEGWSFTFSTGPEGPEPLHDDGFWDQPDPYGEPPSGTSTGEPPQGTSTGAPASTSSSGGEPPGLTSSTGEAPAADDTASDGCGCTHGEPPPWGFAWLLLLTRRRRGRVRAPGRPGREPLRPPGPSSALRRS